MGTQLWRNLRRVAVIPNERVEVVAEVVKNHLGERLHRRLLSGFTRELYALDSVELQWQEGTAVITTTAVEYAPPTEGTTYQAPKAVAFCPLEVQARPAQSQTVEVWLDRKLGDTFWPCEQDLMHELLERWPHPERRMALGNDDEAFGIRAAQTPDPQDTVDMPPSAQVPQPVPNVNSGAKAKASTRTKYKTVTKRHQRAYSILAQMQKEWRDSNLAGDAGRKLTMADYQDRLWARMKWTPSDRTIRRILDEHQDTD